VLLIVVVLLLLGYLYRQAHGPAVPRPVHVVERGQRVPPAIARFAFGHAAAQQQVVDEVRKLIAAPGILPKPNAMPVTGPRAA
jgi:hypothetical protein